MWELCSVNSWMVRVVPIDISAINAFIYDMASITIRRLPETTKRRLRIRAARNGRSMEQEARELLEAGLAQAGCGAEKHERGYPKNLCSFGRSRFENSSPWAHPRSGYSLNFA
jgi:hypothetical protein